MVKKSRHHNRYQYIQFHKNTFSVAETRSWILKDAAVQQRLWTPTRPLINYLQWNVSKQTKRSIKSLQNKIKYLLLVKFFCCCPFSSSSWLAAPRKQKIQIQGGWSQLSLKCALGSRIRRLHYLKVWLRLLYHLQGGKNCYCPFIC